MKALIKSKSYKIIDSYIQSKLIFVGDQFHLIKFNLFNIQIINQTNKKII